MLWTDLELEKTATDEQVRAAFAQSFAVPENAVKVIEDVRTTDPWTDPETRIVVKRSRRAGDFPLHLRVVLGSPPLDDLVAGDEREHVMVQRLADRLRTRVLISDDAISPYSWLLVTPGREMTSVLVEAARLDDDDAFVLLDPTDSAHEFPVSNEALARG